MKIVLAVDDSPCSKRMLAYLGAHPEWLAPSHDYTVVHANAELPNGLKLLLDAAQVRARYEQEAHAVFAPVKTFLEHHGIHAACVHEAGEPAQVIARVADRTGAHLVMAGSHGHGSLAATLLGSTATRLLSMSKVPVLLIR